MPDFDFFVQALKAHKVGGRFLFSCPLASHGKGNGDRNPSVELIDHNPHPPRRLLLWRLRQQQGVVR